MSASLHLLIVGRPGGEFRTAAAMARDAGAEVRTADTVADALAQLRFAGAGLALVDVEADVAGFIRNLRAERFALPVIACGIDAPAAAAAAAIRAGARDYLPLPPDRELIAAAILSVAAEPSAEMLGCDPIYNRAVQFALAVATSAAPVLIAGEPGAGKQLLARAVHAASGRSPLVVVDCAADAPEVVASELWGHEAGAFAGAAARRAGAFEAAAGGTLLLRHVEALDAAAQGRLATTLREGSGARLVATAGPDHEARLRPDLLARLSLVRAVLPPLRARGADIALLARAFAERFARANAQPARSLSEEALALLSSYTWPGNVRELEDLIHRATLVARGAEISPADLVRIDGAPLAALPADDLGPLVGRTVEDVERELILRTLERCRGNRTSASTILGISVRTMRNKLRAFIDAGHAVAPAA